MEFINNLGPIGKLLYKSNVSSIRHIGYYFDEQLITDVNMYNNTYLMVSSGDQIPDNTTCLMINMKISFERLNQIVCDTNIHSLVIFKDTFVENINKIVKCKNIKTLVCYNAVSLNVINSYFPNLQHLYIFRQDESKLPQANEIIPPTTTNENYFAMLRELYVYSSGNVFQFNAPNLEHLSIYVSFDSFTIDINKYPKLHTLRVDEKINILGLKLRKSMKILQFFPSTTKKNTQRQHLTSLANSSISNDIDIADVKIEDLLLTPSRRYLFKIQNVNKVLGVYANDINFFNNNMTIDFLSLQVYDNLYPLKMCSQRFTNSFYKYFPFPSDINNELIERFNIQKQRENLLMIFNFDFMHNFNNNSKWQSWYNACIETYHRIPIIMQNGQLMLTDGSNEAQEKQWPHTVNKVRRECIILLPEEELIYINCSPLRLQTLVDKIKNYRSQKFIINKLWLVTNGFEINTKDIEDRIDNIIIVHNEIKMYITF